MTIQVRKMTEEDVPAVDRLMQEGHRLHVSGRPDIYRPMAHPIPLEELSAMVCDPSVCILLAEIDGTTAGMCILFQKPPSSNPLAVPRAVTHMDVLCVEEQYQGQGKMCIRDRVYSGGVLCNTFIRETLSQIPENPEAIFAKPEFSSDNAAGVAVLGSLLFQKEGREAP